MKRRDTARHGDRRNTAARRPFQSHARLRSAARRLSGESLEDRRQLAAVSWTAQSPLSTSDLAGARHIELADLDGDSDLDFLVASAFDGHVGWYPNLDGQAHFGDLRLISAQMPGVALVIPADLNGDQRLDVVAVSAAENRIAWFPQGDAGQFGPLSVITDLAVAGESVHAADLDGDGDLDLVSTSSDEYDSDVSWYENLNGQGTFGDQRVISTDVAIAFAAVAGDLDGDGDLDVVSASYLDNKVAWYSNLDGRGQFGPQQPLSELTGANEVTLADLDGDEDLDIIAGSFSYEGSLVWYQNLDSRGTFDAARLVDQPFDGVETIQAIDLDGDGDRDLLTESLFEGLVLWYENIDGLGAFGPRQVIRDDLGSVTAAMAGDLDGDLDLDVAFVSLRDDSAGWIEHIGDSFSGGAIVSATGSLGADDAIPFDVDGDGDLDVAVAALLENRVEWYENLDGRGQFSVRRVIDDQLGSAIHLSVGDVNGDGRPDLLATGAAGIVAWYENLSQPARFGARQTLSDALVTSEAGEVADLDDDGDLDVVVTAGETGNARVIWFQNLTGQGDFGEAILLDQQLSSPREVVAGDLDGDGDTDLAVVSIFDNQLVWFENLDEQPGFAAAQLISAQLESPVVLRAADLDEDGDLDLIVAAFSSNSAHWFANLGGGTFGEAALIGATPSGPEGLEVADVDGDGDADILTSSVVDDALAWFENLGQAAQFAPPVVIDDRLAGASSIRAADLDGDGDLDLLATAYDLSRVVWYRNDNPRRGDFDADGILSAVDLDLLCAAVRDPQPATRFDLTDDQRVDQADFTHWVEDLMGTTAGDANLDGVFNSSDLVQIFTLGQYEDVLAGNSGWASGDWNCDGEFTTADLVSAFQRGSYSAAANRVDANGQRPASQSMQGTRAL